MARKPPGTLSLRESSERIGCHYETIRSLVERGVFGAIRPLGKGRSRQAFIPLDEVDAFREGQEGAVAKLKESKAKAERESRTSHHEKPATS